MPAYLTILKGIKEKVYFSPPLGKVLGVRGVSAGELEDGNSSNQTGLFIPI